MYSEKEHFNRMDYTNLGRLAPPLFYVLSHDTYEHAESCFGVTTLNDSPRIRVLRERHDDEIVRDAAQSMFALLGTGVHSVMSKYPHGIQEKRFYAELEGVCVAGIPDLVEPPVLYDYKVTSVWTEVFGIKDSWEKQMNVYRWILRQNDIVVNELSLLAIFRDWTASQVKKRDDYPPFPAKTYDIPMWTLLETQEYVRGRIALHVAAEDMTDDDLLPCTPEERWQRNSVYAVYQGSQRRAKKLCDSEAEARHWINGRHGYTIQRRPEEWKRCELYCDASDFCNHWLTFRENAELGS
jgi:hypothetical protein